MFVGTEIRPPSRTPTPPPPPVRLVGAGRNPDPARGGNVPARGTGPPTLPPAPMLTGGVGIGGRPMSAIEAALARPTELPVRSPDVSRQRPRSEHGQVGGPVATKARTNAPPNVLLTLARDAAIRRDFVGRLDETLEDITRMSRCNSVHCGSCHWLSPIGSFRCGFCDFQVLTARDPTRRVPDIVGRGLDRNMLRPPLRGAEHTCGHTRSASGDERKSMVKLQKHIRRWDNDTEYRVQRSRQGMIRTQYNTHVVFPWMAMNVDDTPPVLPQPPLGIPAVATVIA